LDSDYRCTTNVTMLQILNDALSLDFPKYNFTFNDSNPSEIMFVPTYEYPNQYKLLPTIYQPCHYKPGYYDRIVINITNPMPLWYMVFFILSWVGLFVGLCLVSKFGSGCAKDCARGVLHLVWYAVGAPYYVASIFCYGAVYILGGFFCNYEMPWDLDKFCKKGGLFLPLVFCWKKLKLGEKCSSVCKCLKKDDTDVPTGTLPPETETPPVFALTRRVSEPGVPRLSSLRRTDSDPSIPQATRITRSVVVFAEYDDSTVISNHYESDHTADSSTVEDISNSNYPIPSNSSVRFNLAAQVIPSPQVTPVEAPPEVNWEAPPPSYDDVMSRF